MSITGILYARSHHSHDEDLLVFPIDVEQSSIQIEFIIGTEIFNTDLIIPKFLFIIAEIDHLWAHLIDDNVVAPGFIAFRNTQI